MELYKAVAMATQIIILAISGIVFVIWMGASSMGDIHGIAVGALFILMAALQAGNSALVWKQDRKAMLKMDSSEPQELEVLKASGAKEEYA